MIEEKNAFNMTKKKKAVAVKRRKMSTIQNNLNSELEFNSPGVERDLDCAWKWGHLTVHLGGYGDRESQE